MIEIIDSQHLQWKRYINALIDCNTVHATEVLRDKLYKDYRAIGRQLKAEYPVDTFYPKPENSPLGALAKKCNIIPSLAVVIGYEIDRKKDNQRGR